MNNKAMALVEIVVSMLILAVAALGVTSTLSLVSSNKMRSAGGSSIDLQAASYARDTLESLKNNVSTDATRAAPLANGSHEVTSTLPAGYTGTALPASFTSAPYNGTRTYTVSDVLDAADKPTGLKKVTVAVQWTD